MYKVSQAFLQAIADKQLNDKVNGTIKLKDGTIIDVTEETVKQGSLKITGKCTDIEDFELGCVNASEMQISIITEDDRYLFNDGIIELRFGLEVGENTFEYIPLGVFNITDTKRSAYCVSLVALDNMILLDENIDGIGTVGTAYDLTTYCCEKCGVIFGMTKKEVEALPNGGEALGVPSDSPIKTCRDLISHIAQILGGFACCDREGQLIYRALAIEPVVDISADQRTATSISDFKVAYSSVSMTIGEKTYTKANEETTGATLELESNPLLKYANQTAIETVLGGLLARVSSIVYTPFQFDYWGNPALDIGDVFTTGNGNIKGEITGLITNNTWIFRGKQSLKGAGKDPKLKVKETQTQKKLNSTASNSQGIKEVVYYFENAKAHTVKTKNEAIIQIQFVAIKEANPIFNATIVLNVESAGVIEFAYILDNTEYRVKPLYSVNQGYTTISLFLPLYKMQENMAHQFEVLLKSSTATGTIAKQQIQATIVGQGLSAEANLWDGTIKVTEEINPIGMSAKLTVNPITDRVTAQAQTPITDGISESFELIRMSTGISVASFYDTVIFGSPILLSIQNDGNARLVLTYDNDIVDEDLNNNLDAFILTGTVNGIAKQWLQDNISLADGKVIYIDFTQAFDNADGDIRLRYDSIIGNLTSVGKCESFDLILNKQGDNFIWER